MFNKTIYTILGISTIISIILLFRCVKTDYRVSMAGSQSKIMWDLERNAILETNAIEVVKTMEYIINFYPSGSAQESNSALDLIVEGIRSNVLKRIIIHLRTLPGPDYGEVPESWIKEFNLPPRIRANLEDKPTNISGAFLPHRK